jgi:hypothetical protein
MKLIATVLVSLALTGCATAEYQAYADVHKAQAQVQAARYKALADIAQQGDTTAKVAAVITLNQGNQTQQQIAAPRTFADHLLQWTSVVLPSATNIYGIQKQAQTAAIQSTNATALGMSTNAAFVGIASKIQAPAANITTTTTTTATDNSVRTNRTNTPTTTTTTDSSVRTDNTHTPTIVTQPDPVIVTQPAPVVITPIPVTADAQ